MPSVIATIKVKDDKIEEAKSFLKQLAADTLAKEKGTLAYLPHQKKDDPTTFVFYEKYASDADFATHGKNLAGVGKQFAALVAGPPQIVVLEEI
jgi:quinol monooxygenase YgiN